MSNLPITQVATTDLSEMLNPQGGQRMELPGFDAEFVDFPDYIIRITDRIWHDRDVEKIHDYYAKDCIVHTQLGTGIGIQPVIDGTYATMKSFPDRVLDPDNVIWSTDAPQAGSDNPVFYSSHRITSKMTNLGPSEFGAASGQKIRVITIADCACRDNVIFEEWLVRDYAAIVQHMGFDVAETAAKLASEDLAAGNDILAGHAKNIARIKSNTQMNNSEPQSDFSDLIQDMFSAVWQDQDYARMREFYDFRVGARYSGDRDLYGPDQIQSVLENLLGALSDVKVSIDHICDIPYLGEARDVAVRWSLSGKHTGVTDYGDPTGEMIFLLGVSHYRVMKGRIREDVTIWDDVALRRMIDGARLRG